MGNMFSLELWPRGKVLKNAAPRPIHQTPLAPSDTGQTKKKIGARGLPEWTRPLREREPLRATPSSQVAGTHACTRVTAVRERK